MVKHKTDARGLEGVAEGSPARFTAKQDQYLAYIHLYRKLHRQSPSEIEIAEYFRVSPPSAHQMIVHLEEEGLITREAGVPRSVRLAVPRDLIPDLESEEENVPVVTAQVDEAEAGPTHLYTLEVFILDGPMTEKFAQRNPVISRTIKIKSDQGTQGIRRAAPHAPSCLGWDLRRET